jgi:hypothetical protein
LYQEKFSRISSAFFSLRTEVRGDFNIHGTKYFYDAVFHQKSKNYDVVRTSSTFGWPNNPSST